MAKLQIYVAKEALSVNKKTKTTTNKPNKNSLSFEWSALQSSFYCKKRKIKKKNEAGFSLEYLLLLQKFQIK